MMKRVLFLAWTMLLYFSAVSQQTVKMTIDGKDVFVFDSSRIQVLNNHHNLFLGEDAGTNNVPAINSLDGSFNTFLGAEAGSLNTSGQQNAFVGSNAGYFNDSGKFNSFFGNEAGRANTTGEHNTYLGQNAGASAGGVGTGDYNTLVGSRSGEYIKTGFSNTALGYQSLLENHSGSFNVAIGDQALRSNTFQKSNVAVGTNALSSNGTGVVDTLVASENVAIGTDALMMSTSGFSNVAVGHEAMKHNTTGWSNTAIGYKAMISNLTGQHNTAVGEGALGSNTLGHLNVALGDDALLRMTNGSKNTALGQGALEYNLMGQKNVAIGYRAGSGELGSNKLYVHNDSTSQGGSLIYGEFDNQILRVNGELQIGTAYKFPIIDGPANQVLKTNGSGQLSWDVVPPSHLITDFDGDTRVEAFDFPFGNDDIIDFYVDNHRTFRIRDGRLVVEDNNGNIALGALGEKPTGSNNTFVGDLSGKANTTGNSNSFFGQNAGAGNMQGRKNTFLGQGSGIANTSGVSNTFVGQGAGFANTTGSKNTYIGELAGPISSGDSMNVSIGYHAGASSTGSHQLFIDNTSTTKPLIHGFFDGNYLDLNARVRVDQDILVGHSSSNVRMFIDSSTIQAYASGFLGNASRNLKLQTRDGGDIILGGTIPFLNFTKDNTRVGIGIDAPTQPLHIENYWAPSGTGVLKVNYTNNTNTDAYAVHGICKPADNYGYGAYFEGGFIGSENRVDGAAGSGSYYGTRGFVTGSTNTGNTYGVFGFADGAGTAYGVYGSTGMGSGTHYAVYANGDLAYSGSLINASDQRLKKNIVDIPTALNMVNQLSPKSYEFRTSEFDQMNLPKGNHFGFLAQDVELVLPELVKENAMAVNRNQATEKSPVDDISMKGVNYIELIPILTKAIQEQQEMINDLRAEIEVLKKG